VRVNDRLAAAASIVVRHAGAYTDLIVSDVDAAGQGLGRRLWAGAILAAGVAFAAAMACVWVIAVTWDTAARIWAIAGLLALFATVAVIAYLELKALKAAPSVLSRTAREWEKDRVLLEELLTRVREAAP
jgi:uncharacterized membrane protein YqjE